MSDLSNATRELFLRTLVNQIFYKLPVLEELQRRRQITFKGGTSIKQLVDTAEIDDQGQDYAANEPLTDSKTDTLEKPSFTIKLAQLPLRYDVNDELQNHDADKEIQLLNLSKHLTKKGHRGAKIRMSNQIWNSGSVTPVDESGTKFQSIVSALDHDATYGGLTRSFSSGTRDWWQGADPAGLNESISSSSQDTQVNLTLYNLRKWINETSVTHNMESEDDLYICMCPTLWDKLAAEMESRVGGYKPSNYQRQGIRKMDLDGHQIVSVPYLQKSDTTKKWVVIMNMQYWELRIHTKRNFKLTDFKWQGDRTNGYDYWLARILWAGNFVCWKPNSSMWLSNVV